MNSNAESFQGQSVQPPTDKPLPSPYTQQPVQNSSHKPQTNGTNGSSHTDPKQSDYHLRFKVHAVDRNRKDMLIKFDADVSAACGFIIAILMLDQFIWLSTACIQRNPKILHRIRTLLRTPFLCQPRMHHSCFTNLHQQRIHRRRIRSSFQASYANVDVKNS